MNENGLIPVAAVYEKVHECIGGSEWITKYTQFNTIFFSFVYFSSYKKPNFPPKYLYFTHRSLGKPDFMYDSMARSIAAKNTPYEENE